MGAPERMIPHNVDAEEAVLGSLLIDPEALYRVAPFLKAGDFYVKKNEWIYGAILSLHDRREPIDFITLCDELERRDQLEEIGGSAYITHLVNTVPSAIHVESYGHIVEDAAVRRRLLNAASEIAQMAYKEDLPVDTSVDQAEQALFSVSQKRVTRDLTPVNEIVRQYYDRIEYLYAHRGEPLGVPTGYTDIDRMLGGFQKSDFVIIAARPSVGKTSLCLSMARNAAQFGKHVAIFSLEMSSAQIVQRILSAETGIDTHRLRMGELEEGEWPMFVEATGRLAEMPIYVDDTPAVSVLQLRTKARRLHAEHGLDLIFIDYLQLMSGEGRNENRVQEVSYISRSLKAIARELDVPVVAASQLSRSVEQRVDKKPILADLRESGCLTGDTLIQLADGQRVPICTLAEEGGPVAVMALNETTWKVVPASARKVWCVGTEPVYRLVTRSGRAIRATANHKFRTLEGWMRLDHLSSGDTIASPRQLNNLPVSDATIPESAAALLGHLLGDGCTLPRHAIQYTTNEHELADVVINLAKDVFGDEVNPRVKWQIGWWQVFLSSTQHLTHGVRNPVSEWLDELGVWGYRSHEKFIPGELFEQPTHIISAFLRHLWSTDGCLGVFGRKNRRAVIYYATSSARLARDVQHLLMRIGIFSRVNSVSQGNKGRNQWHVTITGKPDILRFVNRVGAIGKKTFKVQEIKDFLQERKHNTNRDIIPKSVWRFLVEPARVAAGVTARGMQASMGMIYCGSTLYKANLSRERAAVVARAVNSDTLAQLSCSDVYWDQIVSIEPDGVEQVFDIEVPVHHNFVANDIVVHNSLEQDADVVVFIYRDELYHPETEKQNIADIIIAKHRNGPTGIIQLFFLKRLAQFRDAETHQQPVDF